MIASLGVRGEPASVAPLAALLDNSDAAVSGAAAQALGGVRTEDASRALAGAKSATVSKSALADASFSCAEKLLADGKKAEALATYKRFLAADQPKHVRLAATRGMLACTGKAN